MNILAMYGMKPVVPYNSKHGITSNLPLPNQLVGIELEIENFSIEFEQRFGGITFTADGSLRSSPKGIGIEAITQPVAIQFVPSLLTGFYKKFEITADNYTERCSTHVHFNVQHLTLDQISTICLVYQTVERLLFRYIGHNRGENIFCVPWNQCNLSYNIVSKIAADSSNAFRRWQKYSALNLIPITTQGTMEFRHLYGTCDVALIVEWISIIAKMFEYAQRVTLDEAKKEIVGMNTVSNYHEWLTSVFGALAGALQSPNFEIDLSVGVNDIPRCRVRKRCPRYKQ